MQYLRSGIPGLFLIFLFPFSGILSNSYAIRLNHVSVMFIFLGDYH